MIILASIALAEEPALTDAERKDCKNVLVPAASISRCMTAKSVATATAAGHPTTTAQTTSTLVTTANVYPYPFTTGGLMYSGYFTNPGVVVPQNADPAAAALFILNERAQWAAIDATGALTSAVHAKTVAAGQKAEAAAIQINNLQSALTTEGE